MEFKPAFNLDQENEDENVPDKHVMKKIDKETESGKERVKKKDNESDSTWVSVFPKSNHPLSLKTIHISPIMFNRIYKQRKEHQIFQKLCLIDNDEKSWFYKDNKLNKLVGPFNNKQMDALFGNGSFNRNTVIKTCSNEKPFFFSYFIKKYYKAIVAGREQQEQSCYDATKHIKRQDKQRKRFSDITDYKSKTQRTGALFTKLAFMMEIDSSDSEDESMALETRPRSFTRLA